MTGAVVVVWSSCVAVLTPRSTMTAPATPAYDHDWPAEALPAAGRPGLKPTRSKSSLWPPSESARLAELVDARDLKSRGPQGPCRFESGSGHHEINRLALVPGHHA